MGPGPITTYPIFNTPTDLAKSIHRSGWDACDTRLQPLARRWPGGNQRDGRCARRRRRQAHRFVRVREAQQRADVHRTSTGSRSAFVAYTDATNGITPPHPWSLNTYPAANPKAGAKAIIHDARKARDAGRRRGDRPAALGRRELPAAERVAARGGEEADRREGDHRRRRPGPARRPADRARSTASSSSSARATSSPTRAPRPGCPTETQDGLIALLHFKAVGDDVTVRRVTYVPTWVRLGDYVVLPGESPPRTLTNGPFG